ncbi:glycoside hydrolase family protein [Acidithiobacillus sp. M4-SHS-6]|uniref:glycoside hydrolase family protein n=1 Tax=Acidithiobacillus sp. M4-SHS-6 TaxID=3383024 RepID=UPI0039BE7CE0
MSTFSAFASRSGETPRSTAYRSSTQSGEHIHTSARQAGYWTIGYDHLCDAQHPPITEAEADAYLARDLSTALAATLR